MLQSNDRWPHWDREFGVGDEESEVDKADVSQDDAGKGKPVGHRATRPITDNRKMITGHKPLDDSTKPPAADMLKYASLGTELVAGVLVGVFLGWLFNRITGYGGPWALAIGVLIGALAGFLNLYRALVEEEQRDKEERPKSGSS